MADEYGVPEPGNTQDYQQFMPRLYDLIAEAGDLQTRADAIQKLAEARLLFLEEFEQKHPGSGKGRAVWR